jgi:hypothetical protein
VADYRSDISPVEELLLEELEEREGPKAAQKAYDRLTGGKSESDLAHAAKSVPKTDRDERDDDEEYAKLIHLWEHHMDAHAQRGEVR